MKLHVISDPEGNILATSRAGSGTRGAPSAGGITAKLGQTVHEIEVPDAVGELDAALLHWRYKVEVRTNVARIVEIGLPVAKP